MGLRIRRKPPGRSEVRGAPLVAAIPSDAAGAATIPFVGLAEGMILAAIRKAGAPLQRIRPALDRLRDTFGLEHVLASQSLYTDGAEVLYDFAERAGDTPEARSARELVVVRKGQHVFASVIDEYLQRVQFAGDGYAELIHLPRYRAADVVADPRRGFGQPIFSTWAASTSDAVRITRETRLAATPQSRTAAPLGRYPSGEPNLGARTASTESTRGDRSGRARSSPRGSTVPERFRVRDPSLD